MLGAAVLLSPGHYAGHTENRRPRGSVPRSQHLTFLDTHVRYVVLGGYIVIAQSCPHSLRLVRIFPFAEKWRAFATSVSLACAGGAENQGYKSPLASGTWSCH